MLATRSRRCWRGWRKWRRICIGTCIRRMRFCFRRRWKRKLRFAETRSPKPEIRIKPEARMTKREGCGARMERFSYTRADFEHSPMIVFYETTRACDLMCKHCRADAQRECDPGEL